MLSCKESDYKFLNTICFYLVIPRTFADFLNIVTFPSLTISYLIWLKVLANVPQFRWLRQHYITYMVCYAIVCVLLKQLGSEHLFKL